MKMKATLASAVLLGLLAWSMPSFAEVQNVKVGGDVTVRGFYRKNLDLHDEETDPGAGLETDRFFMHTTGVNIGADLTENVSVALRVVNERDWDSTSTAEASGDIDLSQSYLTLRELFYSPLTLRVGTQPIVWGRGFVLGSNLFPSVNSTGDDRNATISANEYTDATAFDAIRATLDLSNLGGLNLPLSVDYVYIKLDENAIGSNDDVNLQGVNLSSKFDAWDSETELYLLNKRDKAAGTVSNDKFGAIFTLGTRGSVKPVDGAYVYGELAYQFGTGVTDPSGNLLAGERHQAWAINLGGDYTLANVATTPKLGLEWRFYSGKDKAGGVGGWAPMAPGYFTTAIREFQTESTVSGFYATDQEGVSSSGTNQHEWAIYGSLTPLEDLVVGQRYAWFFLDEGSIPPLRGAGSTGERGRGERENYLGFEWDTNVVYHYTDDVQLGLLYAFFNPGSAFRKPNDDIAQQLVTTVSVKF